MTDSWYMWVTVFAVCSVGVVWFAIRQRRQVADDAGVCGKCAYPVRGLSTPICPECGADRRVVGIREASVWNRISANKRRRITAVVWSGWLLALTYFAWTPYQGYLQPGKRFIFDDADCELTGTTLRHRAPRLCISRGWEISSFGYLNVKSAPPGTMPERWAVRVEIGSSGLWPDGLDPDLFLNHNRRSHLDYGFFVFDERSGCHACVDPTRKNDMFSPAGYGGCESEWQPVLRKFVEKNWTQYLGTDVYDDVILLLKTVKPLGYQAAGGTVGRWTLRAGGSGRAEWQPDKRVSYAVMGALFILWLCGVVPILRKKETVAPSLAEDLVSLESDDVIDESVAVAGDNSAESAEASSITSISSGGRLILRVAIFFAIVISLAFGGRAGYREWQFRKKVDALCATLVANKIGVHRSIPKDITTSGYGRSQLKKLLENRSTIPFVAGCIFRDLYDADSSDLSEVFLKLCDTASAFESKRPGEWDWLMDEINHFPGPDTASIIHYRLLNSDDAGERRNAAYSIATMPELIDRDVLRTAFDKEDWMYAKLGLAYALRRAGDDYPDEWLRSVMRDNLNSTDEEDRRLYQQASEILEEPIGGE